MQFQLTQHSTSKKDIEQNLRIATVVHSPTCGVQKLAKLKAQDHEKNRTLHITPSLILIIKTKTYRIQVSAVIHTSDNCVSKHEGFVLLLFICGTGKNNRKRNLYKETRPTNFAIASTSKFEAQLRTTFPSPQPLASQRRFWYLLTHKTAL